VKNKKEKKDAKKKGIHKPSGDGLLPSFSLELRVNTSYLEHQGIQIVSLCYKWWKMRARGRL